jgi:hypothetical protein
MQHLKIKDHVVSILILIIHANMSINDIDGTWNWKQLNSII